MGLIFNTAEFLLSARAQGAAFERTVTLGRQNLYLTAEQIGQLRARYGPTDALQRDFTKDVWADGFLREFLGAEVVDSIDCSAFEGATLIHDLNLDIPSEIEGRYDAVVDLGALEHVFNFPTALKNCMRLVRVGGSLIVATPANNHCGHGFYQFSPELFFRAFSQEQGFRVRRMVLVEHPYPGAELSSGEPWFDVSDPAVIGARVGLVTRSPVMLMIHAERVAQARVFDRFPQQSDYAAAWARPAVATGAPVPAPSPIGFVRRRLRYVLAFLGELRAARSRRDLLAACYARLPPTLRTRPRIVGFYQKRILYSIGNRAFFRPVANRQAGVPGTVADDRARA
jgi:hypothetical protein